MVQTPDCFTFFSSPIGAIALPQRFNFPFHYQPHPLCLLAAKELQERLENQQDLAHNFGLVPEQKGEVYGKMFGVLIVQNHEGKIGYLSAFSGKIAGENQHPGFVPPVFDLLAEDGFYRKEESKLNELNRQIERLEQDPELDKLTQLLTKETQEANRQLNLEKERMKSAKAARQQRREENNGQISDALEAALIEESKRDHFLLKDLKRQWKERLELLQAKVSQSRASLLELREQRKTRSSALQQKIFEHYSFLNQEGAQKSLADIFQSNAATPPPAGAGECAAPKLLQYAFLHGLKPISMAEFWWGESPIGEIRRHGQFYPACRGKCEPILGHMLKGMDIDPNPMLSGPAPDIDIEILYEDEALIVVNKPPGLLSVPGKNIIDSVYLRVKKRYPEATGPLIVHRLDLSTSGLMLIAKTPEMHKNLQSQFIKRSIKKRYVAVLDGIIEQEQGIIDLPLRVDLDDRPRQMVCYEHGESARTEWQRVSVENGKTRIYFFPVTGRTHQLRVHAAHHLGLNTPILGDDIYGTPADRLYLHADRIVFTHPVSGEARIFELEAAF